MTGLDGYADEMVLRFILQRGTACFMETESRGEDREDGEGMEDLEDLEDLEDNANAAVVLALFEYS